MDFYVIRGSQSLWRRTRRLPYMAVFLRNAHGAAFSALDYNRSQCKTEELISKEIRSSVLHYSPNAMPQTALIAI